MVDIWKEHPPLQMVVGAFLGISQPSGGEAKARPGGAVTREMLDDKRLAGWKPPGGNTIVESITTGELKGVSMNKKPRGWLKDFQANLAKDTEEFLAARKGKSDG